MSHSIGPLENSRQPPFNVDDGIDLTALEQVFDYLADRASEELQAMSVQALTHALHDIQQTESLLILGGLSCRQARAAILTEGDRTISLLLQGRNHGIGSSSQDK